MIQFTVSTVSISKTVLFRAIQFGISTQFKCQNSKLSKLQLSSIWPIDRTLSGATTPGQNGNEGLLHIPQNSSITGTSPSDCFVSHARHSWWWWGVPSVEMQSVYSTAPVDWAKHIKEEHSGMTSVAYDGCSYSINSWITDDIINTKSRAYIFDDDQEGSSIYLPTRLHEQNVTQYQFLSEPNGFLFTFPSPRQVAIPNLLYYFTWRKDTWIHTKGISAMGKCKKPRPGFELMSPSTFPSTISISHRVSDYRIRNCTIFKLSSAKDILLNIKKAPIKNS